MPDQTDPQFLAAMISRLAARGAELPSGSAAASTIAQLIACLPPLPGMPDPVDWATRTMLVNTSEEVDALRREIPGES